MDSPITIYTIRSTEMLSLGVIVLFIGMFLNRRIAFLERNYIPPAVTGGLLFSLLTWFIHERLDVEIRFDLSIRDLLLLVFFSTIGLSARLRMLASGGWTLAVLVLVAAAFLALQNIVGIGSVMLVGAHPAYGLLAGSISFAGGHGTAIAWGAVGEQAGLVRASELSLAFATFGLVAGGLVGGPIARRIIETHEDLRSHEGEGEDETAVDASEPHELPSQAAEPERDWLFSVLSSLLALAVCVSLGDVVNRSLEARDLHLPGFLTAMFIGIVISNGADGLRLPLARSTLDRFGEVSLHLFLAMSMMSIELWTLGDAAGAILLILAAQILLMTIFAIFVVFRVMGRDYDAVVIASGFAGMGLGATPVAIANMTAVTDRYGPSTKAFLVVPLVGAFFIDLLNAGTINFFIRLITRYLA